MRAALAFLYDFFIGDDWTITAGIIAALCLTAVLATTAIPVWWLMPLAVLGLLALSLTRAVRRSDRASG